MIKRAVVLSSGGLDSTVCVAEAVEKHRKENVSTVSVIYGQKHIRELFCAKDVASYYNVKHYELDLSTIFKHYNNPLLMNSNRVVEKGSYLDQQRNSKDGIVSTYIPFRNGTMLSAVASFAMSIYPDDEIEVYLGNHADDAVGNAYPDCSLQFIEFMAGAIYIGTGNRVSLKSPFVQMKKADIVKRGLELNVPFDKTWSCYEGGLVPCGKCGTCIDRAEAFKVNGIEDPLLESLK